MTSFRYLSSRTVKTEKKQTVIDKLKEYLKKFLGTTEESANIIPMHHNVVSYTMEGETEMLMAAEENARP